MYYIYFKRKDNSKFIVGANVLLRLVDEETTEYGNREEHLFNVGANRAESLPLDLSEKAYILKVENDEDTELGEVLYSDCADISDICKNKENIISRFNNPEFMNIFLQKYLELSSGKGIKDEIVKEIRRILELSKEKKKILFPFIHEYFRTLTDDIFSDYESYRYAYIASKSIELEKKKIKCKTINNIGKRKIH